MALALSLNYTGGFQEGDWVNFGDFRFISSVANDQTVTYFASTNGVIRYDRFANRWLDPMTITDGLPEKKIDNIAYDPDYDRLWIATPVGNAYYQPTFRRWYSGGDFPAQFARNDFRASTYSILTTEFGYAYQNGRITDLDFRSFRLTRGAGDGFDHIYVGTWGLGPVVINTRNLELKSMPYGPYSDDASALIRVGDRFWLGAGPGDGLEPGITMFDTSLQEWHWYLPRYTDGLASANVMCAVGDDKVTWIGTDYGVVRYDINDDRFTAYADFSPLPSLVVTSLAFDSAWVYIGTDNGLGFLSRDLEKKHKKRGKQRPGDSVLSDSSEFPLSGRNLLRGWRINCLKVIEGFLYVGTDRGVLRRAVGNYGDLQFLNTPDKMLTDDILDMAGLGDTLLFLTKNDIITINTRTGETGTIADQSHFGSWHIRKFIADSLHIWAATDIGLWMYRFSDGYRRLFNVNDGMISADVRGFEIVGDYIWMATPKGVIRFYWNRPGRID